MKSHTRFPLCIAVLAIAPLSHGAPGPGTPLHPCDSEQECEFIAASDNLGVEAKFGEINVHDLIGKRTPLRPISISATRLGGDGGVAPSPNWSLTPLWDSDAAIINQFQLNEFDCEGVNPFGSSAWNPNEFDTAVIQGVFYDDMWNSAEQESDFAERTIFMVGASNSALSSVEAGYRKTNPVTLNPSGWQHPKYTVGSINRGITLKGGTTRDVFHALGSASFGFIAFDSALTDHNFPGTAYTLEDEMIHGLATGAENHSFIGKRISASDEEGGLRSGVDARTAAFKESDRWEPVVAIAGRMVGTISGVWIDGQRDTSKPLKSGANDPYGIGTSTRGTYAGLVQEAIGVDSYVIGAVEGSYINVNKARGLRLSAGATESLDREDADCGECLREDSIVRDFMYIEQTPLFNNSPSCPGEDVEWVQTVGMFVPEMIPNSGGGEPVVSPELVGQSADTIYPERRASIVARGDVVFGDGQVDGGRSGAGITGYDTDVLHVRDVLHLNPRTSAPQLSDSLAPSDKVGLMYFDLNEGAPRISVPAGGDSIAWVSLALAPQTIEAARDLVGGTAKAGSAEGVVELMESARADARAGKSAFAVPTVTASPFGAGGFVRDDGFLPVNLILSGFETAAVSVYSRHAVSDGKARTMSDWKEVGDESIVVDSGLGERFSSLSVVLEVADAAPGGVQILVVDEESGRRASTSIGMEM